MKIFWVWFLMGCKSNTAVVSGSTGVSSATERFSCGSFFSVAHGRIGLGYSHTPQTLFLLQENLLQDHSFHFSLPDPPLKSRVHSDAVVWDESCLREYLPDTESVHREEILG